MRRRPGSLRGQGRRPKYRVHRFVSSKDLWFAAESYALRLDGLSWRGVDSRGYSVAISVGAGRIMIHRQITHADGTFSACAACKKEPHHYVARGTTSHEDAAFCVIAERHQLECRCDRRTGWCNTLADALCVWCESGETLLLANIASSNVHPIRIHRPIAVAP